MKNCYSIITSMYVCTVQWMTPTSPAAARLSVAVVLRYVIHRLASLNKSWGSRCDHYSTTIRPSSKSYICSTIDNIYYAPFYYRSPCHHVIQLSRPYRFSSVIIKAKPKLPHIAVINFAVLPGQLTFVFN